MKTKTKTAEVLSRCEKAAEAVARSAADPATDLHRVIGTEEMHPGKSVRQGDLYITRLSDLPIGCERAELSRQLAPGTTQGSRHCVRDITAVKMYRRSEPTPLDGPVIQSDAPITISHPEHGWYTLPAGLYAVRYQRAYADELRRVVD